MSSFRGFIFFLLVIALCVLVALLLLKDNLDDQIRSAVLKKLRSMLSRTNVQVTLDQAEYKRGKGIRLRGLSFVDNNQKPVLYVETILVQTDAEIWDLIGQKMASERIDFDGVRVFARQESSEKFNLENIINHIQWPKVQKQKKIPTIKVRDCVVRCELTGVDKPIDVAVEQVDFGTATDGKKLLANARISSDFFRHAGISGEFTTENREWRLWGNARQFWLNNELFEHVPNKFKENAAVLNSLQAKIDFDFEVTGKAVKDFTPQFMVVGNIADGVINDERLPFPVNYLRASFQADNSGLKFENVVADSLLGKLNLNLSTEGLSTDSPFELVANVDPLFLDRRLQEKLPKEAKAFLRKYSPSGKVRLNSKLRFQEGRWVPDIVVDLLDVSFTFHKFPYPLKNATGRITLDEKEVTIDVIAFASGQRVELKGSFDDPGPKSHGELRVDMNGVIPIDAKVLGAMEQMPDIARLTHKFHPRGFFGFHGLLRRVRNSKGEIDELFRHEVSVQDVEFKYDVLPVAFDKVNGSIVITETGTSFIGFRGKNVNSENMAQGAWDPVNGLNMTIDSFDVELNDSLKSAMPKPVVEFWNQLRPSGTLQAVRSRIRARPGQPLEYDIEVRHENKDYDLMVYPTWFPYELRNITAQVSFRPGSFTIRRLKGRHRKSMLTVSGHGNFSPGHWECHFERLNFDRLVADREFTSALPETLGNTLEACDVNGLFNVAGRMSFRSVPRTPTALVEDQVETSWDLTADIDRGYVMCGVALEDIYGAVRLTGVSKGNYFESLGGMEIDSLVWNDIQFRNIRSPVYLDNNEALLGLWATAKRKDATPQPLTGVLFGGKLAANAQFSLHGKQPFQIQATLNEGNLQDFTFEVAPEYGKIVGKGFAGIRVNGDKTGTHALRGEGEVRLVDAKISEVPVMLSMLKLLSVKQVDRTLFNESNIHFTMKGEHLFFDDLEFLGDAISIKGNGEMDFDQKLDLQFYTAVGRDGFRIPVVSPLLGIASQQLLVIDVKGTTGDPKVKKNFFKILNGKLKENWEDFEDSIDEGSERIRQAAERPFENVFR